MNDVLVFSMIIISVGLGVVGDDDDDDDDDDCPVFIFQQQPSKEAH